MSDRGHGLSGRMYRRRGHEHPGGKGEEESCGICEKFYEADPAEGT